MAKRGGKRLSVEDVINNVNLMADSDSFSEFSADSNDDSDSDYNNDPMLPVHNELDDVSSASSSEGEKSQIFHSFSQIRLLWQH